MVIGFSVGAKVGIMASFEEVINCLVCLGPQMQGMAGNNVDAVDTNNLLQLKPPTLFVTCLIDYVSHGSMIEAKTQPQAACNLVTPSRWTMAH